MDKIRWGIIGCGDVTEMKSGPAFNKVNDSELIAVMRRDEAKAADYAARHNVPKWYTEADKLINDPDINAIYIATPPSTHKKYTIAALKAGKPVYVEKPMALDYAEAAEMADVARKSKQKLSVAHYRREQPKFKKIKELLDNGAIGKIHFCRLFFLRPLPTGNALEVQRNAWRLDPAVSGGGLFHDLAPHQLDLMYYLLGNVEKSNGFSLNQSGITNADDMVTGSILFSSGAIFSGVWNFAAAAGMAADSCEIFGSKGKISFAVFDHQNFSMTTDGYTQSYNFDPLMHVQQPMIQKVVEFFLGKTQNPSPPEEGAAVMKIMQNFTSQNF